MSAPATIDALAAVVPVLRTERLVLRAPRLADFDAVAAFYATERSRFVGGPSSRLDSWRGFAGLAGQWLLRGYGRWVVADPGTDAAMGLVGPHFPEGWPEPEIAWVMFDGAEGRGLAHEAAQAARRYAYGSLGWTTAISLIDPANHRSAALGRRMGCAPEGTFEHETFGTMHVWRHPAPEHVWRHRAPGEAR